MYKHTHRDKFTSTYVARVSCVCVCVCRFSFQQNSLPFVCKYKKTIHSTKSIGRSRMFHHRHEHKQTNKQTSKTNTSGETNVIDTTESGSPPIPPPPPFSSSPLPLHPSLRGVVESQVASWIIKRGLYRIKFIPFFCLVQC